VGLKEGVGPVGWWVVDGVIGEKIYA